MFEQDTTFGMKFTYHIDIYLQMFLSTFSEESGLNDVDFGLIYLFHTPSIIKRIQFHCSLPIYFSKKITTTREEPLEYNNKKKKIK